MLTCCLLCTAAPSCVSCDFLCMSGGTQYESYNVTSAKLAQMAVSSTAMSPPVLMNVTRDNPDEVDMR